MPPPTARRVVASDVNPRAIALATLTIELNGLDHVSVRLGDRFDPVAGERFDLIVANPPYVISPLRRYLFRDSGLPVDELCRSIVQAAPAHLTDGGHCQLLASWAHVAGEDWRQRLERWFAGTGCDAYVLEREALEPAAHAASWLRQTERPERVARRLRRMDALQRGAPHRGDRVRVDHDAQAGGRSVVVPCRGGATGRRDAVRRSPRRRVRARRLPPRASTTTACSRRRSPSLPTSCSTSAAPSRADGWQSPSAACGRRPACATPATSIPASPPSSSPATADGRSATSSQASPPRPTSRSPRCAPRRCRSSGAWSSRPSSCPPPSRRPGRSAQSFLFALRSQPAVTGGCDLPDEDCGA